MGLSPSPPHLSPPTPIPPMESVSCRPVGSHRTVLFPWALAGLPPHLPGISVRKTDSGRPMFIILWFLGTQPSIASHTLKSTRLTIRYEAYCYCTFGPTSSLLLPTVCPSLQVLILITGLFHTLPKSIQDSFCQSAPILSPTPNRN